jgi:ElaB/YqjD/DUF883 family membrane-anchored ribosome-binding protein
MEATLPLKPATNDAEAALREATGMPSRVAARFDDFREAARQRMGSAAQTADGALHAHPYRALGFAAAAGVLVGFLLARR